MTATNATANELQTIPGQQPTSDAGPFFAELYRYHGFTLLDRLGERVGIVDWIWRNDVTGEGEHIGLNLQWVRGRARAVPAGGAQVDRESGTIYLPFSKCQISTAPRFRIDRPISGVDLAAIAAHFASSAPQPGRDCVRTPVGARSIADAFTL